MRQLQRSAVAFAAGLVALACMGVAEAREGGVDPQREQGTQPEQQGAQKGEEGAQKQGQKPETNAGPYGAKHGLGAGISGQKQPFELGPLETKGMGAGLGQETGAEGTEQRAAPAPVPQYWLADASLFASNAGNTAQTIAHEQKYMVQAPEVLSNQAQFMLAATDRAISSLQALQSNAENVSPSAVTHIREAVNQLNAARAQATQTLEAAKEGRLGPENESTVRSAYEHIQSAEKAMQGAGRAYGVQVAIVPLRPFSSGRGFGAGIGGACVPHTQKAPEGGNKPPEGGTKAPEKAPEPAPAPNPTP
jgi:hypothetical protein